MSNYTAPSNDAADFALESYTAPSNDNADFQFAPDAIVASPTRRSATVTRPTPTTTGVGTVATIPTRRAGTFARQSPTATGAGTTTVALGRRTATLSRFAPGVVAVGTAPVTPTRRTLQLTRRRAVAGTVVWTINGNVVQRVTDETATRSQLALTVRVTQADLLSTIRTLKSDEGKVDILGTDAGGYTAVDRAGGDNTFEIIPPVSRLPLRRQTDIHVESYEETLVSADLGEWDVELELIPTATRTDTPSASETVAPGEWGFETRYGTLATDRVTADFVGTGADGVERFEIRTPLLKEQAHVFEAALAQLGGVGVQQVPDATNVAIDDAPGDPAIVTVDAPDGQTVVDDGDYVVLDWESTRLNDRFQEVEFELGTTTV